MNRLIVIASLISIFVYLPIFAQNDTILLQSDTSRKATFGYSLTIDYPWLLVGNHLNNKEMGSVYAFRFENQAWHERYQLMPTVSNDHMFGLSISSDHSRLIIGSPGGANTGAAYIYNLRQDSIWNTSQRISASDGNIYDGFGVSTDISYPAGYAIIGAYGDDDNGQESGSAYIFKYHNNIWTQQAKLLASDGLPYDDFGVSVAIEDTIAVIGAPNKETILGQYTGQAYVFTYHDTSWVQRAILLANDLSGFDFFGRKVSISNHRIMVSAPAHGLTGTVYSFIYDGSNWTLEQKITPNATNLFNAQFGSSLFLDADRLLVGTPPLTISGVKFGGAFLFEFYGGQWHQKQSYQSYINPGQYGKSVCMDGRFIAIGKTMSTFTSNLSGEVHIIQQCGPGYIHQEPLNPICKEQLITLFTGCPTDSINWYNPSGLLLANSHYLQKPVIEKDTFWAEYWSTSGFYGIIGYDTIIVQVEPQTGFSTDTACLGQPTHFTDLTQVSTPWHYQWDFNNDGVVDDSTQGNTAFTYPAEGYYTAKLTVENMEGCRDSVLMSVQVGCSGINTLNSISALQLKPNPANQDIFIAWSSTSNDASRLEITDALGRMVYRQTLPAARHHIALNIQSWPAGLYLLRIRSTKGAASLCWVKE